MSQYALRLPNSLMEHVKKLSRQDRVSMNQFMLSAIAALQRIRRLGNAPLPQDELPAPAPARQRRVRRSVRRPG